MQMVDRGSQAWQIEKERVIEGTGCDNWLIRDDDE